MVVRGGGEGLVGDLARDWSIQRVTYCWLAKNSVFHVLKSVPRIVHKSFLF